MTWSKHEVVVEQKVDLKEYKTSIDAQPIKNINCFLKIFCIPRNAVLLRYTLYLVSLFQRGQRSNVMPVTTLL
jgi:hypothetical protein